MNYSAMLKNLNREVTSYKQYHRLPTAVAVLAAIATAPFLIAAVLFLIAYKFYGFFYNLIGSSAAYLETWVHEERQGVNHIAEAVLYFVTTPTIFFLRVILSAFAGGFFFLWFALQCFYYIFSLGGIRFQPYINSATFEESDLCYKPTASLNACIAVSSISFGLMVLWALFSLIAAADGYGSDFIEVSSVFRSLYFVFTIIAIPCCGRKSAGQEADASDSALPEGDDDELELPED